MASGGEQALHKFQSARNRYSPREHVFATNPILELSFLLQDEDLVSGASQLCGER
jgi:hypothetical protein